MQNTPRTPRQTSARRLDFLKCPIAENLYDVGYYFGLPLPPENKKVANNNIKIGYATHWSQYPPPPRKNPWDAHDALGGFLSMINVWACENLQVEKQVEFNF